MTDINISEVNINGQINTSKKIEKKKNKKYPNERNDVLMKIYDIIGVSDTKPYFRSHEIDNSDEILIAINNIEDEIKQYFNVGSWPAYRNGNNVNKKALSIVRSVFKEMNVDYSGSTEKLLNNPDVKYTTLYVIKSK